MVNQDFVSKLVPTQANHTYNVNLNVSLLGKGNATLNVFDNGFVSATTAITNDGLNTLQFTASGNQVEIYITNTSGNTRSMWLENLEVKDTKATYFTAEVKAYSDYFPFGQIMPNRHGYTGTKYRFGFQDQEVDDELKGEDNSVNFTFRMFDPRLGKFFAVDPLAHSYPFNSPYAFSENNVIHCIEFEGLEKVFVYNVWKDNNSKVHKKFSHVYTDKNLKVNINQINTYYGGKVPGDVTFKSKEGAHLKYDIKTKDDKNLKSNKEVSNFFNPSEKAVVKEAPPAETPAETKAPIDKMIDDAWNNGSKLQAVGYLWNKIDQSMDGEKGIYNTSDYMDKIGGILNKTKVLAPVGGALQKTADGFRTYADFNTKSSDEAFNNLYIRIKFTFAGAAASKVIDSQKKWSEADKYSAEQEVEKYLDKKKEKALESVEKRK